MECGGSALTQKAVLGERLSEIVAPGGEVGVRVRLNITREERHHEENSYKWNG